MEMLPLKVPPPMIGAVMLLKVMPCVAGAAWAFEVVVTISAPNARPTMASPVKSRLAAKSPCFMRIPPVGSPSLYYRRERDRRPGLTGSDARVHFGNRGITRSGDGRNDRRASHTRNLSSAQYPREISSRGSKASATTAVVTADFDNPLLRH